MTCVVIHKNNRKEIFSWLSQVEMPYWASNVMDPSRIVITFYSAEDKLSFLLKFDELYDRG